MWTQLTIWHVYVFVTCVCRCSRSAKRVLKYFSHKTHDRSQALVCKCRSNQIFRSKPLPQDGQENGFPLVPWMMSCRCMFLGFVLAYLCVYVCWLSVSCFLSSPILHPCLSGEKREQIKIKTNTYNGVCLTYSLFAFQLLFHSRWQANDFSLVAPKLNNDPRIEKKCTIFGFVTDYPRLNNNSPLKSVIFHRTVDYLLNTN